MNFKRNDNGEILCRVNIIVGNEDDGFGEGNAITADFIRHLGEQHRCINGQWMLTANISDQEPEPQLELACDVPEREVERCMSTIRKAGLKVKNEGRIDANTNHGNLFHGTDLDRMT
jgi:hypothetical protein